MIPVRLKHKHRLLIWLHGLLLLLQVVGPTVEASPVWDRIRQRGEVVVGVKADYPPFGMLDTQANPQGFEHDMALDLARRLGVRLQRVNVTAANRLQRLEEGTVDVVIATLGDTRERRQLATLIEPHYYASGVTLFTRPAVQLKDWESVRGATVCVTQGSYFNRPLSQRYNLDLLIFNTSRDARLAARDGRCLGYLFDDTAQWHGRDVESLGKLNAALPSTLLVPWAIAIARLERGGDLEQWISDQVVDWHRSGFLLRLESKWNLPASPALRRGALLYRGGDVGQPACQRDAAGKWPGACSLIEGQKPTAVSLTHPDVTGLHWGRVFAFMADDYDRMRWLNGLLHTLSLMLACIVASLLLGVCGAVLAQSRIALLRWTTHALATYGRMTPPLLQMYLVFFGFGAWMWNHFSAALSPWVVAVACLSYYTGCGVMSALLETIKMYRSAQPDFRLNRQTFAMLYADSMGGINAALANVLKATMMASVLAVPELLSVSTSIMADRGNVTEMMNSLLLAFLILIALSVRLLDAIGSWLRRVAARAAWT